MSRKKATVGFSKPAVQQYHTMDSDSSTDSEYSYSMESVEDRDQRKLYSKALSTLMTSHSHSTNSWAGSGRILKFKRTEDPEHDLHFSRFPEKSD